MNEEYIPDGVDESGNFVQYSLTDRIKSVVTANYSPDCSRGRIFGAVKFLQSRPEILLRNHIISVSTGLALWYLSGLKVNYTLPVALLGGSIIGALATTLYDHYRGVQYTPPDPRDGLEKRIDTNVE